MDFSYRFPAVRGRQARRDYFVAMIPLRMLPRLFTTEGDCIQPEFRAQRRLNEQRVPEISSYILSNPDTYVFSALASSIDGDISFEGTGTTGLGILEISMDATLLINDGQHRIAAIIEALGENPGLGDETIAVVLYEDQGLARSQQMFTDLNKHAVRTSNSIAELYDSRDELAVATRNAVMGIPFLNRFTDKERDNLGKYSASLFTLNMFYKANRKMLCGSTLVEGDSQFIEEYWRAVCKWMSPWQDLQKGRIGKVELREETIATQAVTIQALGRVGSTFRRGEAQMGALEALGEVDWSRRSPRWSGRTINERGRIVSNERAICLAAISIKGTLKIPLTDEEHKRESEFQAELANRKGK